MNRRFLLPAGGIVLTFLVIVVLMVWATSTCAEVMQSSEAEPVAVATPAPGAAPGAAVVDDGSGRVVQVVGIVVLGGGLYYFWRRQRSLYESIKAREGPNLNSRVRSSIAQLNISDGGQPVIEERIRGIEGLAQIVNESPQDYWPVMEVLCRYVRQNAPRDSECADEPDYLRADVQMAMTVIAARRHSRRGSDRLNLSQADLRGAQLPGAHLERVDLSGTRFDGATLVNANLAQADLTGTNLTGADLRGAQGLSRDQLDAAITSSSTQLPEDESS